MLLTITCMASPETADATLLGYLLHKHPDRVFEKELTFGIARVFYTEAMPERCTAALLVELDSVDLVRNHKGAPTLTQYVSDRPYVPSSFLSVALGECYSSAMAGRSKDRQDATEQSLSLSATLTALSCDGGEGLIRDLFEPLGYTVTVVAEPALLDDRFPDWGAARQFTVTLAGTVRLADLLTHLYVLVPVLDNVKHYYIGEAEVEKLLRKGEGWLSGHPAKERIASRYLRYRRTLTDSALARLAEVAEDGKSEDSVDAETVTAVTEEPLETPLRLNDRRIEAAIEAVRSVTPPAKRVVDMGCGEGKTMMAIRAAFPTLERLTGVDVAMSVLERASRRLHLDRQTDNRVVLLQGSAVYRDDRLRGYDLALLTEVIEHLDPARLPALEASVFGYARPRRVFITTPNAEYNTVWSALPSGKFRHPDHRFEWARAQFQTWATSVASRYGYTVTFGGIGDEDAEGRGTPTQSATFDLK